jgi:hypothetical protein
LNLEKRVNNIICPLEVLNDNDFAKDYIPLIEKEGVNLAYDPSHDKDGNDCFMYSFVHSQEMNFQISLLKRRLMSQDFSC